MRRRLSSRVSIQLHDFAGLSAASFTPFKPSCADTLSTKMIYSPAWSVRCSAYAVTSSLVVVVLRLSLFPIYRDGLMCTSAYACGLREERNQS